MGGGRKCECGFCRRPFRVHSRRKGDSKEDSVEEAQIPGSFSRFAPVWTHLGTEVTAKVMEEGTGIVPRMCGSCFEIVAEVEKIHEEIQRLQGMLEVAVEKLRGIVEDSAGTIRTEEESVFENSEEVEDVKVEPLIEPKEEEWVTGDYGGGDGDSDWDPSYLPKTHNDDHGSSTDTASENDEVEVTVKQKKPKLSTPADPLGLERPRTFHHQVCEFCTKKIKLSELPKHLASHVGGVQEYVLRCLNPNCKVVFIAPKKLGEHLDNPVCRRATESLQTPLQTSPLFTCEICGFRPPHPRCMIKPFRNHLKIHEVELLKKFSCPVEGCSETFALKQSVHHHIPSHQKEAKPLKCHLCKENFTDVSARLEHIKSAHPEATVIHCRICNKIFPDRDKWLLHHTTNHRKDEINCDICKISLADKSKILKHYFEKHGIGKQFICEICPVEYYSKSSLVSHMKSHGAPGMEQFKCDRCDASFPQKIMVATHKIKEHGDKGFQCTECGRSYGSEAYLICHVKLVHLGEKKRRPRKERSCHDCGITFESHRLLVNHVARKHRKTPEIRAFVCEVEGCGKAFYDQRLLDSHKKGSHAKVKPVCEVCGMTFANKKTLRNHKVVHTGERPYACEICGQRFRQRVTLTTHLKSHAKKGDKFKPGGEMRERAVPRRTKTDIDLEASRSREGGS